jgi:superfamily II DNA or RNA helicase
MAQMPDDIQKFFPEISIGAYYGKEKNLDADVVLITYHSFNKLVEAGTIQPEETGCIILDEAHNALSDWRRDIIDRFSESIRL